MSCFLCFFFLRVLMSCFLFCFFKSFDELFFVVVVF